MISACTASVLASSSSASSVTAAPTLCERRSDGEADGQNQDQKSA
jgi:hypothetical protein